MAAPPPPPQHVPQQKSRTWLWLLLGGIALCMVLCAGLVFGIGFFGLKKVKEYTAPVTKLNQAIGKKEYKAAYALMSLDYQQQVSQDEFTEFCKDNAATFSGKFTGRSFDFTPPTARIGGAIGTQTVEFSMVLDGDKWRVSQIAISGGDKTPAAGLRISKQIKIKQREDLGKSWKVTLTGADTSGYKTNSGSGTTELKLDIKLTDPKGTVLLDKKAIQSFREKSKGAVTWTIWFELSKPIAEGDFELDVTVHDMIARTSKSQNYLIALKGK